MKKNILFIFCCLSLLAAPMQLRAEAEVNACMAEQSQMEDTRVTVVNGNSIRVQNAMNAVLEIYNITGVKVASYKIDGADKTISPNLTRGCYIVKVNRTVRKISIL